jgi:hypothetical protein
MVAVEVAVPVDGHLVQAAQAAQDPLLLYKYYKY